MEGKLAVAFLFIFELFRYLIMKVIKQIMLMLMLMSAFFTLNSCLQARVSLVNSVEGIRKGHLFLSEMVY